MAKKDKDAVALDNTDDLMSIVEFSEDITNAEEPDPLPEGEYPAQIIAAEVKISQTKGTKYAQVQFRVAEDDYPADYDAQNAPGGKTLRFIVGMEDNVAARARVRKFSEAIGAPMSRRIDVTQWVGLAGIVSVKHDTYEGVLREQVSRVTEA